MRGTRGCYKDVPMAPSPAPDGQPPLDLGSWAAAQPDAPALVMGRSGESLTYAELDAASNRVAPAVARPWPAARRPRRHPHGERRPLPGGRLGGTAHGSVLHGAQQPSALRRGPIHPRRLRRHRPRDDPGDGPGRGGPRPGSGPGAIGRRRAAPRVRALRGGGGALRGYAGVRRVRGTGDAVLVGHDRAAQGGAQGRCPARPSATRPAPPSRSPWAWPRSGAGPGSVYLSPAPLYHSAPLVYSMSMLRLGATVVVMEHFDALRASSSSSATG